MTHNVKLVPLQQLFSPSPVVENFSFDRKVAATQDRNIAWVEAYHLYVKFDLTLKIAAPEDDQSAIKNLHIIEQSAAIAEQAAKLCDARILEIQGDCIHFLVEASHDLHGLRRLLTLAYSVVNIAYEKLAPIAGDAWRGCKAAADHGKAVILISDVGGGSIISLGSVANRPAKRLFMTEGVKAGHLAMPEALIPPNFNTEPDRGWKQLNLLNPSEVLRTNIEMEKRSSLGAINFDYIPHKKVASGSKALFDAFITNASFTPFKIQGICLRADLDGFSRQVEDAFAKGPLAVTQLAVRFLQLLELPKTFKEKLNSGDTLIFPWAGDCATLVILPNAGESFSKVKETLPSVSALTWHNLPTSEKRYLDSMSGALWAVGLAAGDQEDGNEGRMLITEIKAQGRSFRVVAGWAARRAHDAYQLDGIRGTESVITEPDYQDLAKCWQDAFSPIHNVTSYRKATRKSLQTAQDNALAQTYKPRPVTTSAGVSIPAARSYSLK